MVYPANNRLYLRSMSDLDAKPIPGTDEPGNAYNPVFSPDGRWIVFFSDRSQTLKKIAVTGGTVVTLCASAHPDGITWGAAGILFGQNWRGWSDRGILRISPDGGKPDVVIAVKNDEAAAIPQLLPDNETVLFTLLEGQAFDRWDKAHIVVQSLKSGQRTTLIEGASDGRYLPSGHIVYSRGGVSTGSVSMCGNCEPLAGRFRFWMVSIDRVQPEQPLGVWPTTERSSTFEGQPLQPTNGAWPFRSTGCR